MKITLDTESDLGKRLLCGLKKTKHFFVEHNGSADFESLTIYDHTGNELAHGCPWYISKENFTCKLVEQHKFSYDELKEIKKVYDYIDPDQGYDVTTLTLTRAMTRGE